MSAGQALVEPAASSERWCRHEVPSLYGRCTACGMTWDEQMRAASEHVVEVAPAASAEVVVRPPSSQAGLAAVRYRIGGPVAEPVRSA